MDSPGNDRIKKAYQSPEFYEYGGIRELTNANDMMGNPDNSGNPGMDKT